MNQASVRSARVAAVGPCLTGRSCPKIVSGARTAPRTASFGPSLGNLALAYNGPLVNAVLLDDLAVMEHVELLSRILACEEHDCLFAAGVVGHEVGHVVDLLADDDPAVRLRGVLGQLRLRD